MTFKINPERQPNGFCMKFSNGYEVSVQWGAGNYCTNRNAHDVGKRMPANTAEILLSRNGESIKDGAGLFHTVDGTNGWCSTDEVASILYFVSKLENPDA